MSELDHSTAVIRRRGVDADALATAIRRTSFFRRPPADHTRAEGHREWLHFSIVADHLTLLVNMSVVDDPNHRRTIGRVLVLVREGDAWTGGSDEMLDAGDVEIHGGQVAARLGESYVELANDGRFHLKCRLRDRATAFELKLRPLSFPSLASNVALAPGEEPINWVVVPSLRADGWLSVDDRRHELRNVSAYHDHNWGYFTHRDFAWQWGHALPDDRKSCPYSAVFTRLLNGAQTESFMQALLLWRDGRQYRVFREDEVTVRSEGLLRQTARDIYAIPRGGRIVAGGRATDVPKRFIIEAEGNGDAVACTFESKSVARVVVPNEHDLSTTLIHEVTGRFHLQGHIRDEYVELNGHGVFEFLGRGA